MKPWTETEQKISSALQGTIGVWTKDCIDPDDLIELIEEGGKYPNANLLMTHLTGCDYCRHAYREMSATLSTAEEARAWQTAQISPEKPEEKTVVPALIPQTTLRERLTPLWWKRLMAPTFGFALAGATALLIYVSSIKPNLDKLQNVKKNAQSQQGEMKQQLAEAVQQRDRLSQQYNALQVLSATQSATQTQEKKLLEDRSRTLQAEVEKNRREARWLQNALKTRSSQSSATQMALAETNALRMPEALPPLDRRVLRGGDETEIRSVSPTSERLLSPKPTLQWGAMDSEVNYRVRVLDPQNKTLVEGMTEVPHWKPEQALPRRINLRWVVEATRKENNEIVARSAIATFLILGSKEAEGVIRAKLELAAHLLKAGLVSEAQRELDSVLEADPHNPIAQKLKQKIQHKV